MTDDVYERVAYDGYVIPGLCPEHLLRTSWLFGGPRPRLAGARVLEIGCGEGANLLPLAFYAPSSTFVGLDRSASHIERARRAAAELGLSNLTFIEADVRAVGRAELGADAFEYVLCHGVMSWVAADVADEILAMTHRMLAPDGLACVSYNALPGWKVRGLVREMLMRAVGADAAPIERARRAKAFATAMLPLAPERHPYGMLLARELRIVLEARDAYVVHEYLAPDNHAFWLRDFAVRAASHGLAYVAEAGFNQPALQPNPATVEAVAALGLDPRAADETVDALLYRQFRMSVLSRSDAPVERRDASDIFGRAQLALALAARGDPVRLDDGAPETFVGQHGFEIEVSGSAIKAAMMLLSSVWPAGLDVDSIRARVIEIVERHGLPAPSTADLDELGAGIVELFRLGQADVRLLETAPKAERSGRPRAHALARHEARVRSTVTSTHHVSIPLDDVARSTTRFLDGSRTVEELVELVAAEHPRLERAQIAEQVSATLELLERWGMLS